MAWKACPGELTTFFKRNIFACPCTCMYVFICMHTNSRTPGNKQAICLGILAVLSNPCKNGEPLLGEDKEPVICGGEQVCYEMIFTPFLFLATSKIWSDHYFKDTRFFMIINFAGLQAGLLLPRWRVARHDLLLPGK